MPIHVLLATIVSEEKSLIKHVVVPLYMISIFLFPHSSGWQRCIQMFIYLCILLEIHWDPWIRRLMFFIKFEIFSTIISSNLFSTLFFYFLTLHYMCVSTFKYYLMDLWSSVHFSQVFFFLFFRLFNFFCYIFKVTNFSAISNLLFSLTSEIFSLVIVHSNYRISTLFSFIASILHWYSVFIESSSPYFPWSL